MDDMEMYARAYLYGLGNIQGHTPERIGTE
jgi:hypothetical protein